MVEYMKGMKEKFDVAMYVLKVITWFDDVSLFGTDINFEITDSEIARELNRMNKDGGPREQTSYHCLRYIGMK